MAKHREMSRFIDHFSTSLIHLPVCETFYVVFILYRFLQEIYKLMNTSKVRNLDVLRLHLFVIVQR